MRLAVATLVGCGSSAAKTSVSGKPALKITNVSYDPTRELYGEFNKEFAEHWQQEHDQAIDITPSHGASGSSTAFSSTPR